MNVFILSDVEGVTELDCIEKIDRESPLYKDTRAALMKDVNTAVAACFDSGAENVYVLDGHAGGGNFIEGELDSRACQINIVEMNSFAKAGKFDYCIELGAHAMAGTLGGFLDHTQNSRKWFEYSVNGIPMGEVEKHAVFFSEYGVKTVFVSGDEAVCREVRSFLPGVSTVAVKNASERNKAELYGAEESRKKIYDGIKKALSEPEKTEFIEYKKPIVVRLTLYRTDMCEDILAVSNDKNVKRLDARTLEKTIAGAENYADLAF